MTDHSPQTFWDAAFTPERDFIIVFLMTLFATTLTGNLLYTLLTDRDTVDGGEFLFTTFIIIVLALVAGFIWERRKSRRIVFDVVESAKLQRVQAVIMIPSNTETVRKIVVYHVGILRHIWMVGDDNLTDNYNESKEFHKTDGLSFHRILAGEKQPVSIYEGYMKAIQEAFTLGIPEDQIVVDITGGTKPMSVAASIAALNYGLKVSYLQSDYQQSGGSGSIQRTDEKFTVVEFQFPAHLSGLGYNPSAET